LRETARGEVTLWLVKEKGKDAWVGGQRNKQKKKMVLCNNVQQQGARDMKSRGENAGGGATKMRHSYLGGTPSISSAVRGNSRKTTSRRDELRLRGEKKGERGSR